MKNYKTDITLSFKEARVQVKTDNSYPDTSDVVVVKFRPSAERITSNNEKIKALFFFYISKPKLKFDQNDDRPGAIRTSAL